MELYPAEAQGAPHTTSLLFRPLLKEETPPVELIALPTADDVSHTLPSLADLLPEGNL